jgi:hypothetical protein
MNNHPIEGRLRDALAARAQQFSASPDAWQQVQAKDAGLSGHRGGRRGWPGAGWLARHSGFVIPAAAAATVAAVVLGATALTHGFSGTRSTVPGLTVDQAVKSVSCPANPASGEEQQQVGVPLPAGFVAQAAIRCIVTDLKVPGQGRWQFQLRQVAYNGLAQLTTALRRPSMPTPANQLCALPGIAVEPFSLLGRNGQLIAPRLPTEICGGPQRQALTALGALHWKTVAAHRTVQVETQQGLASGCAAAWKDMIGVLADIDHGRTLRPSGGGPVFGPQPASLLVCEYRDRAGQDNPYLLGGGQVSGTTETSLLQGIASGRATTTCTLPRTTFAVLLPPHAPPAYVEIDGCHRVLRPDNGIAQATTAALAIINQVRQG